MRKGHRGAWGRNTGMAALLESAVGWGDTNMAHLGVLFHNTEGLLVCSQALKSCVRNQLEASIITEAGRR